MKKEENIFKSLLKSVSALILGFIGYFAITIITAQITLYRPQKKETIANFEKPDTIQTNTLYKTIIWNIGYGGLGDKMDFFYDGGKKSRDTKENIYANIKNIGNEISLIMDSIQFLLLQEVDIDSKRSYNMNQPEILCEKLDNCIKSVALNYHVVYVPIPIFRPLGKVKSGLLNLSKIVPIEAERHGFNKDFAFPKNLFMLKRCFMVSRFKINNGKDFLLVNVHNSAYDDGGLREDQLLALKDFLLNEYARGNYILLGGDWNQYPPGYSPNFKGYVEDKRNISIPDTLMPKEWTWAFDNTMPTNRDLQTALDEKTVTQVIDYYLASPNIDVYDITCIDKRFRNADHNPVYLTFKLK